MAKGDILIKNACIITGAGPIYPNGSILIRNGIIEHVGKGVAQSRVPSPESRVPSPESRVPEVDAKGCYVLPGFINPHMHLYSALARGMAVGRMKSFGEILKGLWWKLDRALTLEDVYVSSLLGGIEALKSGVTTLVDHHASYGAVLGSLGAVSEAMDELGLRASLCYEISDRLGSGVRDEAIAESALWLEDVEARCEKDPTFLQRGMVGLHASMTLSDRSLDAAVNLMDAYKVGAHVHVAEGIEDVRITKRAFGVTPVARFVKKGILRKGSIAVHCVHVNGRDISLLKKCGAYVVHNPLSNLNNAVGIAPILEFCRRGIPVAVGTDGMSAGVADDIKLASVLQKAGEGDAQAGGMDICKAVWGTAPAMVSRMFGADVGVLRKGAAADVIIVDSMPPTDVTSANAWWHVLFGVLNSPVRTTIVGGKIRMRDFKIAGIDEAKIAAEARRLAKRLWKRIGCHPGVL